MATFRRTVEAAAVIMLMASFTVVAYHSVSIGAWPLLIIAVTTLIMWISVRAK